MKIDNCAFCDGPLVHQEGRKPKKYCSDTCRQKDFQRKKKENGLKYFVPVNAPKVDRFGNELESKIKLSPQRPEAFDSPKLDTIMDEFPMYESKAVEKLDKILQAENPYPENWEKMSKADKLKWMKGNLK